MWSDHRSRVHMLSSSGSSPPAPMCSPRAWLTPPAPACRGRRRCSASWSRSKGPVAKIIAVIIIIVTGLSLAFGDMGGGFRRLLQIVFGLSIAFAATSFFLSFFSFAGGALID